MFRTNNMKHPSKSTDYSMDFELAMRQFFGNTAYHIADGAYDPKFMKKWFVRAVRKMKKDVANLDSTTRHKERLMSDLDILETSLKSNDNQWNLIFRLFFLSSRLLGYDYAEGIRYHIPFYYQSHNQHYYSKSNQEKNFNIIEEHSQDTRNTITKRKEIIKSLQEEGYDDFHISLILGITEYQLKKLKKEI